MIGKPGRVAMLEQFVADGFSYMFGNPGTVEQGFLDALESFPDLKYVLCLQESVAVAIADGFARASRRPALVQLHAGVGLGNAIGMMYQAFRGHSPLVIVAGDSGVRYDAMDAQMAADLVSMARPVTKWSTRVTDPSSLLRVLRRAVKTAMTPPTGPVFVALPLDVLDAPNLEPVGPTSILDTRVTPDLSRVREAAAMLQEAKTPVIFMGDGVASSDAQAELARVAELLGAEVWGVDSSEVNIAADHPLFCGLTGHMFGEQSYPISSKADAILVCGTYLYPEVFPKLDDIFANHAKVVHIDLNTYEIAKNFPVTCGLLGDPKRSLALLAETISECQSAEQRRAAQERCERIAAANREKRERDLANDANHRDSVPLRLSRVAEIFANNIPADSLIFDEALTHSPELTRYLRPIAPGSYFQTRGGSLGVGVPGAIGLKLADPEKTVIGFTGDGGAMYTIQALWTAAHLRQTMPHVRMDPKFVVCNNRSYRILKLNILQYWSERDVPAHAFPQCFDLGNPELDFAAIARSMGIASARVEAPEELIGAIEEALSHPGPYLLDVLLNNDLPTPLIGCKCGH